MEGSQDFSSDSTTMSVVPTEPVLQELPKKVELDTVEANNESS